MSARQRLGTRFGGVATSALVSRPRSRAAMSTPGVGVLGEAQADQVARPTARDYGWAVVRQSRKVLAATTINRLPEGEENG